jgi:hypothetical protein
MKYLKLYENKFDTKSVLREAIIVFLKDVYSDTPDFYTKKNDDVYGIEVRSKINFGSKIWADINFRDYIDGDRVINNQLIIEIYIYNDKFVDVYNFFKEKIIDDCKIYTGELYGSIKNVRKFIKELPTKEEFELWMDTNKYNI